MRVSGPKAVLAAAALALACPAAGALADDSDVPGLARTSPGMGRSMGENPEMKPFMTEASAPARASAPAAQAAAPAPAAMPAPAPPRVAALRDVDALLRRAEADIGRHRLPQAGAELEQAEVALLNARAAGDPVPEQAMTPLAEARNDLRQGRPAAAGRAAEAAERIIASAE